MTSVSYGFQAAQQHASYTSIAALWREADDLPVFQHSWLFDHLNPVTGPPGGGCLEAWTLLSALATQTRRVRLGVLVSGNSYRHPVVLAQMLATVDHIAGGRVDFGFGAGWHEEEHLRAGITLHPPAARLARWAEACEVVRRLCTEPAVTFQGRHYQLTDARIAPRPERRPTFVLGAGGTRALEVVARYADVWNVAGGHLTGLRAKRDALREHCRRYGRDPDEIALSSQIPVDAKDLSSTRSWLVRHLAAGVRHVVFELPSPWPPGILTRLVDDVIAPIERSELDR